MPKYKTEDVCYRVNKNQQEHEDSKRISKDRKQLFAVMDPARSVDNSNTLFVFLDPASICRNIKQKMFSQIQQESSTIETSYSLLWIQQESSTIVKRSSCVWIHQESAEIQKENVFTDPARISNNRNNLFVFYESSKNRRE